MESQPSKGPNESVASSTVVPAWTSLPCRIFTRWASASGMPPMTPVSRAVIRWHRRRWSRDCSCTNRPARTIATRSHVDSTSESTCEEKITVRPTALASCTRSSTSARAVGSRLAVGSSRISRRDSVANTTAKASFCRMPVLMRATCREQSRSRRAATVAASSRRHSRRKRAKKSSTLSPVMRRKSRASLGR